MSLRINPLIARDYNRGLSATVRWTHAIVGTLRRWLWPLEWLATNYWAWASQEKRSWWARPLTIGLLLAAALVPFDQFISRSMAEFRRGGAYAFGGDIHLTLNTLGQFGDAATSLIIGWTVFLVWPQRRARLWDWAACVGVAILLANVAKMTIGRHRPNYGSAWDFLGPFASVPTEQGPVFAWEFWKERASELGSTPSSHTVAAVVLAMVLVRLEPKLRPMVFACATFVGFNRVLSGYHYPSDVVLGWVLGVIVVRWIWDGQLVDKARWSFTRRGKPPTHVGSRVGKLPALANAIVVQRGEEAHPEQRSEEPPAGR